MRLPGAAVGLLFLASVSGIGCAGEVSRSTACDPAATMNTFVASIRDDDMQRLLSTFTQSTPVLITSTIELPLMSDIVTGESLTNDLLSRKGLYELLVASEQEDSFADVMPATGFADWQAIGNGRFIPPGKDHEDGRTFVRIICESSGAMIKEIGWPAS